MPGKWLFGHNGTRIVADLRGSTVPRLCHPLILPSTGRPAAPQARVEEPGFAMLPVQIRIESAQIRVR